jgi:EpsI family protein
VNRNLFTAIAVAAFALCYGSVLIAVVDIWATRPVYSYGFVLPFVAGYIVWARRDQLLAIDQRPDYVFGAAVTLLAIALLVVGDVGSIIGLKAAAVVVALAGLILLRCGRATLGRVWFPLAYLLLGMPIWDGVIARLQQPSQLLSGGIATGILQTIGIPALHDGIKIMIPAVTLEVMRECSGVNQLMTIIAMTLPIACLMLNGIARRGLLIGLGIVVSYLSNGARIALVGVLAYHGLGDGNLRGAHLLEGLAVSLLGYVLLFACFSALSRNGRSVAKDADQSRPAINSGQGEDVRSRLSWIEPATLSAMLAIGAFLAVSRPTEIALQRTLDAFPARIGDWYVDPVSEPIASHFPAIDDGLVRAYPTPAGERRFVRADDELTRVYRSETADRVRLFIAYHRSQHEGKELAGDLSGLLANVASPVSLPAGNSSVAVNEVTQESPTKRRTILYWYVLNGRVVNDMRRAKMYMVWDAIAHRRTNGAVVMLGWESAPGRDAEPSRRKALELANAVSTLLSQYLPST